MSSPVQRPNGTVYYHHAGSAPPPAPPSALSGSWYGTHVAAPPPASGLFLSYPLGAAWSPQPPVGYGATYTFGAPPHSPLGVMPPPPRVAPASPAPKSMTESCKEVKDLLALLGSVDGSEEKTLREYLVIKLSNLSDDQRSLGNMQYDVISSIRQYTRLLDLPLFLILGGKKAAVELPLTRSEPAASSSSSSASSLSQSEPARASSSSSAAASEPALSAEESDLLKELAYFPKLALEMEAALPPPNPNNPKGKQLHADAKHHLFLLGQGMQILNYGLLTKDPDAVAAALPMIMLDHHAFTETYIKSLRPEMIQDHSLVELTGRSPFTSAFDRAEIWERYPEESINHYRGDLPKALQLLKALDRGEFDLRQISDFATKQYHSFLKAIGHDLPGEKWAGKLSEARRFASQLKGRVSEDVPKGTTISLPLDQRVAGVRAALNTLEDGTPVQVSGRQAVYHMNRLSSASRLATRLSAPEYAAFWERAIQTGGYGLEQILKARVAATTGRVTVGHGFTGRLRALRTSWQFGKETEAHQYGVRRRYPEQFASQTRYFRRLLSGSREFVAVRDGFTPTGGDVKFTETQPSPLLQRMLDCQRVLGRHLQLFERELLLPKREE